MTREEAIREVAGVVPQDTVIVAANGHISRVLYSVKDRPQNFYMIGSMGLAPSIALGVCLAQPKRRAAVFDGDGNVLMGMGSLAQIAVRRPARFAHFCFDNSRHASTGGQRTISDRVDLSAIARAAGYTWAKRTDKLEEVSSLAQEAFSQEGPAFLLIKVAPGGLPKGTARVELTPEQMTDRLREALAR